MKNVFNTMISFYGGEKFTDSVKIATEKIDNKEECLVFWNICTIYKSFLVFTEDDGSFSGWRNYVSKYKKKIYVFFCPQFDDTDKRFNSIVFSMIQDDILHEKGDCHRITFEEIEYIKNNQAFPDRIKNILSG